MIMQIAVPSVQSTNLFNHKGQRRYSASVSVGMNEMLSSQNTTQINYGCN